MNRKILNNNSGFSVIEVLISLAMAAIIITAIGSSLSSIHKLNTASAVKEKALAYAKQSMEAATDLKNKDFDDDLSSLDSITLESPYTSDVDKELLSHDINGNLQSCVTNCDAEKVTVTIKYQDEPKASLSTIFTNWKNP